MSVPRNGSSGFSLVEVVVALGLVSFSLVALLGLFSISLKSNQESENEVQASHILSSIIAQRRSLPKDPVVNGTPQKPVHFVLPAVDQPTAGTGWSTLDLDESGYLVTPGHPAIFRLHYQIEPSVTGRVSRVTLLISWPAAAAVTNSGRMELTSYISLLP